MQFQFLREVDNKMIFVGEKAAYERILEGCKELKKYGVRAVTGACGFFGHYQKRLAAKLDIPVALSSLVQLPWIAAMLKPDEKIAVLTANEESCAPDLLRACSVPDEVIERCVIRGLGKEPQFKVILDDSCEFDNAQIKQELLGKAEEIVCEYPETARSPRTTSGLRLRLRTGGAAVLRRVGRRVGVHHAADPDGVHLHLRGGHVPQRHAAVV